MPQSNANRSVARSAGTSTGFESARVKDSPSLSELVLDVNGAVAAMLLAVSETVRVPVPPNGAATVSVAVTAPLLLSPKVRWMFAPDCVGAPSLNDHA